MKKILIFLVSILASCCFSFATAVTKSVELGYKQSLFSFSYDSSGHLQIIPQDGIYAYDENTDNPGLPYFSVAVYVPDGQLYQNCNLIFSKSLLYDNCVLAPASIPQPTSCITASETLRKASYADATYPKNNVSYAGESTVGDSKIIYFKICPFVYDNANRKLYLAENAKLDITFQKSANIKKPSSNIPIGPGMAEQLTHLVVNPEDFFLNTNPGISMPSNIPALSYVIITSKALADSFIPLRNWKRQKGVWTDILTVENIEQTYEGKSLQEKIKRCLYDLHTKRGLSYVLLGGDDTVVPVRYCRNTYVLPSGDKIPTDLYYSCFDGNFEWDANENGIYGEIEDGCSLIPNVYLSRLPVRTNSEVEIYSSRVISYEKMSNPDAYMNKMLMCGYKLGSYYGSQSDSEYFGDKLYNENVKGYWSGEIKKLYDSYNDFGYSRVYNKSIQEQLSNGYTFADFTMHGAPWCYNMISEGYYDTEDAAEQTNTGYTIITTIACSTNAFDGNEVDGEYKEPCLSESFIRNPKSGIIAYLGCSREGWYTYKSLGPSHQYEARFYKRLFTNSCNGNNFGKVVALSKADLIPLCDWDNAERWVQFGLNPIGDSEMPVFTDTPQSLPKTKVKIENGKATIDAGADSCTVCLMSRYDNGASYYKVQRNVRTASFDEIADSLTLCITKQNYIPKVIYDLKSYELINRTPLSGGLITGAGAGIGSGDFTIGYKVQSGAKNAKIVVSSNDGNSAKAYNASLDETKLRINSSSLEKGILNISLFVDSKLADSISYYNK